MILNEVSEGRWLSPDPLGGDITNPQSLNRYAYALNNPTTLTDPSGLGPPSPPAVTCTSQGRLLEICLPPGGAVWINLTQSGGWVGNWDEFDLVFPTGCDEGGCGSTIDANAAAIASLVKAQPLGGVVDSPANLPGAPVRSQPVASSQLSCIGSARVLQGNAATIGNPGGFSGKSAGIIPVTANGAAVIPSQWGGKSTLRPFLNQIGGIFPNVNYSFQGVVDVVGSKRILNVQAFLMSKNPGDLILELPGAPKDFGVTPVTLTIPGALPCPAGTTQVKQ